MISNAVFSNLFEQFDHTYNDKSSLRSQFQQNDFP